MQRNSQSFLPTVHPYMQPSTSTTSTSESTNATLLPADDPPRLFTSFIHDFDKLWLWIFGANMSPLNTFHDASEMRPKKSLRTLFVAIGTNFPAICTCQDISVLTVIDLSTFACDIGATFSMQNWIELAEYTGVHEADGGTE